MYKILGGDGNEYGPVPVDQLRQWVREGRANAQTQVRREGDPSWSPLGGLAELADVFNAPPTIAPPGSHTGAAAPGPIFDGDYDLDISGCVSRSYGLFKSDMGTPLLATLIYFGIIMGLGILGAIPLIGTLFSLASWVIGGPLLGGFYYVLLRLARREMTSPGDVFAGFSAQFVQLFLGQLVPGLFALLCMLPALVVFLIGMLPVLQHQQSEPSVGPMIAAGVAFVICLPVMIWITTNWVFTLLLIVDRKLDFWTAMKTSWRRVSRHWWTVFGLLIIVGLINLLGLIACCVGMLFTIPIGVGAMVQAYETIFTPRAAQPGPGA